MSTPKSNSKKANNAVVAATPEVLGTVENTIESNDQVAAAVAVVVESKASIGRRIFAKELAKEGGLVRKDVIARLVAEAGLTPKGAATYYQNNKNKAGLVNHKPKVVAEPVAAAE